VWCWGKDPYGGAVSNSDTPWQVEALAGNVLDVAAGSSHVCAVVEVAAGSGDVYCWGLNYYGQLGQGYQNDTSPNPDDGVMPPLRVKGISKVTALFAGHDSTCALTVSQRVVCWGRNTIGKFGAGTDVDTVTLPVVMKGLCA
jgi:alpha-tubulin suppressor-like RCC1 family protein